MRYVHEQHGHFGSRRTVNLMSLTSFGLTWEGM